MTINAPKIEMPVKEARELYRKYKEHAHYSAPIDREIQRTYQLIAQGRVVIRALEAVKQAGLDDRGFPRLAIMQATAERCHVEIHRNGSCTFTDPDRSWQHKKSQVRLSNGTFSPRLPANEWRINAEGRLPTVPIHLRPKRGLANYHVLWEAEWTKVPPVDPFLLRRMGKADLWLVVAAWDLTPVEQAALAGRING